MKYDKLTDVFSAWAEAAAGKSMPHWNDFKVDKKKYVAYIDTEGDVFDTLEGKYGAPITIEGPSNSDYTITLL